MTKQSLCHYDPEYSGEESHVKYGIYLVMRPFAEFIPSRPDLAGLRVTNTPLPFFL
jgi:hypothetical protein